MIRGKLKKDKGLNLIARGLIKTNGKGVGNVDGLREKVKRKRAGKGENGP